GKSGPLLKECIQWIEGPEASNLARAVVRQIGRRKPEKAVAALLAYLSAAEDEPAIAEVRHALTTLAVRDGKPDPVLLAAVKDTDPVRHSVAAEALCTAGGGKVARPLLRDADALLRLRIALVLIERGGGEAVPVLIALLAELPAQDGQPALHTLRQLAGPLAP